MTSPIHKTRCVILLAVGLVCALPIAGYAQLPHSGMDVPELAIFDQTMHDFMYVRSIGAGVLGVMKDGCIVYERGYGWLDEAHTVDLPEDAMMRIASCTKPITAAAIRKLADSGAFDLADFVFDVGQPEGGILNYAPFGEIVDDRIGQIRVQHLIDHQGGWDAKVVDDMTYEEIMIADAMGLPRPAGREAIARYAMGQPLQFDPGSEICDTPGVPNVPPDCYDGWGYSNLGYMLLGLIIEQESGGMDYSDYVRQAVFGPIAGELGTDVETGATFSADQNPREPWYDSLDVVQSVFGPNGDLVFWPYGGWDHEARVSQGGQVAATEPLLKFLQHYHINGSPIVGGYPEGMHTGSLSRGTRALVRQRSDGVNYVVLFNKKETSGDSWATEFQVEFDAVLDAGGFAWPAHCIDGVWVDFSHSPSGVGNFDDPFSALSEGLAHTPQDGRFQVKSGSSGWTGMISQRVEIRAPMGLVSIGE